ncbi:MULTISPECIES: hypothetical protein [unclassified Leeuwenhoekiella]|uniref:hypothetical protein n=1 Tax=unclassified Leeuwenhoekiella TaxID=2615029 RepID=UPI000C5BF3DA|nr:MULTISPECIES: hypothetical protein [unclassified Leeuwenhoekiella]MAW96724.1 hypothetical protein [Leeuwenhoekiella sp.]MBA81613.1 hypothetical protein [Leeuwenhoekiella sp.]|tara:strand:+ start:34203 stop:34625 length:423 start_codon:yes stop_codon:yes gene_type:complete
MANKKNLAVGILTSIIVGSLSYYLVQHFVFNKNLQEELQEAADQLNAKTPMQLDEETTLDSAAVTGDRNFDYYYTLIYKSTEVNKDTVEKYVKPMLVERVKSSAEMNSLKKKQVIFTYNYYGYDGLPAVSIEISPELYTN